MRRLLVCLLALFILGCSPSTPSPLVPKKVPHKPHLREKLAKIEVLDFYAEWCIPCRINAPTVDVLIAQGHKVRKVDIDKEGELKAKYKIVQVPNYVVLKHGEEVFRTGNVQELRRYLNKRLWHHDREE